MGVVTSLGILGVTCGVVAWYRCAAPRATAVPHESSPTAVQSAPSIPSAAEASDYGKRVVAYIYDNAPITRRDLGEYLILRYGSDNIDKMVGQYVIELAAAQAGKSVTAAEIEADIQETMRGSKTQLNRQQFSEIVTSRYGKNFEEWKEDVVKHRLLLTKLCSDRVQVTDEELRKGFESTCGDKIRARVIIWPKEQYEEALKLYPKLRKSEDEFDKCARQQKDEALAAKGGELEIYHNFALSPETEKAAFALEPGELSPLIAALDGWLVLKCVEHVPATAGVKFEDVVEDMRREAFSRKLHKVEIPKFLTELREQSHPKLLLEKAPTTSPSSPATSIASNQPVALIYDNTPITREQLGEWLIARYGTAEIENLINRRIVETAAREKGIELSPAEIDADMKATLKGLSMTLDQLQKTVLKPRGRSLFGWREDQVTRLMLTHLCRSRTEVKEEEIQKAYTAYYGEKIQARIIMWPLKEQHVAMAVYAKVRDNEAEFDRAARTQANSTLAARGGEVEPFGRYTTGNEEMEKAAFNLKSGEISHLVGTPDGFVVIKCVKCIPPQTEVKLETVRAQLTKECFDRKVSQVEIPKLCRELHELAHPKIFITKETSEDLLRDVRRELTQK
jgi:parvulin-like peptidyl-prolyl isomerase